MSCAQEYISTFSFLLPSICVYSSLPDWPALQMDLGRYKGSDPPPPSLFALEAKNAAALDASSACTANADVCLANSAATLSHTPSSEDEASAIRANFVPLAGNLSLFGYFRTPLVRADYDSTIAVGEIVAYAGQPAPSTLPLFETSFMRVAVSVHNETYHRLKLVQVSSK